MLKGCCTPVAATATGVTGWKGPYFHLGSSNQMVSSERAEAPVLIMVLETMKSVE